MNDPKTTPEFEHLLEHLKKSRGFDFTAYKRSTLSRRIDRRLATVGVGSYSEYLDCVEVHPPGSPNHVRRAAVDERGAGDR